jgi:acetyl esterase
LPGELADEELRAYVADLRANPSPPNGVVGVEAMRAGSRSRAAERPPGPALGSVSDVRVPAAVPIRARWYRHGSGLAPVVVYVHGGGWTIGDLETHDRLCRRLAVMSECDVLAVDYRRAPEYPWPAALVDVVQVIRWVTGPARTGRRSVPVGVAGDSAGGHLATLACLWLRAQGDPLPAAQILAYPNTDLTLSMPSVQEKATGWGLDADGTAWFVEQFVPDEGRRVEASPLLSPDLSGLPPAVVVTAEHDVLRDEGDAYAARLAAAGVPVVHRCEPGMVHGFLGMDTISPAAARAGERLFADIRDVLSTSPHGRRATG